MDEKMNFLWDGYCIDFVQHLSKVMEFDYVLVQPKSGYLGELVNGMNNTWDGLVGDLMTGVSLITTNLSLNLIHLLQEDFCRIGKMIHKYLFGNIIRNFTR